MSAADAPAGLTRGRMVCVCGEHLPIPSHSDVSCRCGLRYPRPIVDLKILRDTIRQQAETIRTMGERLERLEGE